MNTLLKRERAIVTEVPGTTRDYLEEACLIKGRLIRLIDTAGLRISDDKVEKIGIERSKNLASQADLVITLIAADANKEDYLDAKEISQNYKHAKIILTKSDLAQPQWAKDLKRLSCHDKTGIDSLEDFLVKTTDHFVSDFKEHAIITNLRQKKALEEALSFLVDYRRARDEGAYEEMLAHELQTAARSLTSVIGDIENDDILDVIFSQFCIGK